MATYSHSRVSCFENCLYQYKLKYIDKVEEAVNNSLKKLEMLKKAFEGRLVKE